MSMAAISHRRHYHRTRACNGCLAPTRSLARGSLDTVMLVPWMFAPGDMPMLQLVDICVRVPDVLTDDGLGLSMIKNLPSLLLCFCTLLLLSSVKEPLNSLCVSFLLQATTLNEASVYCYQTVLPSS